MLGGEDVRVNVYVPDELGERIKADLPDVNVSAVVQDALRSLLECDHDRVACADCGEQVDVVGEGLTRFWGELLWSWEPLVDRGGTAEGAARVAKSVAVRMGVPGADRMPLPRPTRAMREAS